MNKWRLLKICVRKSGDFNVESILNDMEQPSEVVEAQDHEEMLNLVRSAQVDAILIGVDPDESTLQLVQTFKRVNAYVPILFFTSSSDIDFGRKAISSGVEDCVQCDRIPGASLERVLAFGLERAHLNQIITDQKIKIQGVAKMAEVGEMSARILHEICNPLTIIRGYADQLKMLSKRETLDVKKVIHVADRTIHTVDRLDRIITGMKTSIRDGSRDPFESVNLTEVIENAANFVKLRLEHSDVKLRLELDEVKDVECRVVQLSQIVVNLLNNAHDAVEELKTKWVLVRLKNAGDRVVLSIIDSGDGIPADVAKDIFKPMFSTKAVGKGTGLGLSICREIVQSHSGTIEIDQSEKNTCFRIELPKKQLQNKETKEAA